ncbi:MAG: phosphatase domain-containing protein [Sediminicola sp.]|tara:strand:+ start:28717 stop:29691 length:975 start_codon:yes stop_codon:yes gene_type:complete
MKLNLKNYRGYANDQGIILFGHVFKKNTPDQYSLEGRKLRYALSVLRLFNIRTLGNVEVTLRFKDIVLTTKTLDDGYFRFSVPYSLPLESGWHSYSVSVMHAAGELRAEGEFLKPYPGNYGLISDIDDTFLISHSNNFILKIYLLLTRNMNKRKFFDGVVEHYRLLGKAGRKEGPDHNAFFYVSSSEWNLYNLIYGFTKIHDFPKAVLKLKNIKTGLGDFLFTGSGSHDHKFYKIKHLLEFYPLLRFVLLGDDSQQDPYIYERIIKIFPKTVVAVYIRQSGRRPKGKIVSLMENMADMGAETCYYHSTVDAMAHSKEIGLLPLY